MPIELTAGQWVSVAVVAVGAVVGVNALRRDRRWFALCCGLIAAQSLASLIIPLDGSRFQRYLVSAPLGIAVLVILRRVSDEAKLARAAEADAARDSPS